MYYNQDILVQILSFLNTENALAWCLTCKDFYNACKVSNNAITTKISHEDTATYTNWLVSMKIPDISILHFSMDNNLLTMFTCVFKSMSTIPDEIILKVASNIDILKHVCENVDFKINTCTIISALQNRNLECIKYIHENYNCMDDFAVFNEATHSSLECLKYVVENVDLSLIHI